jgi:hypothetical protein
VVLVNFNDYQVVRINEAPGGMGKPGTSATMPAIANATFVATGNRLLIGIVGPSGFYYGVCIGIWFR